LALLVGACGGDTGVGKGFVQVPVSDASALGDSEGAKDGAGLLDALVLSDSAGSTDAPPDFEADAQARVDAAPLSDAPAWQPPPTWQAPLDAPADQWTWIDVEGTHCGDGSPTGFAINPHPGATRLFLYLEGGGGCWDTLTCEGLIQTSLNLGGYDEDTFHGLIAEVYKSMWLFERGPETHNPLADSHFVFIPYCTGDAHIGDAVAELPGLLPWNTNTFYFKGRANLLADLDHIVPTLSGVERVVLSGSSAGGFGAGLNWPVVWDAFHALPHSVQVDLIDDSGPPIEPAPGLWAKWMSAWGVQLPEGCVGCEGDVSALVDYLRSHMLPKGRLALLSFSRDAIISAFFQLSPFVFEDRLNAVLDIFDLEPNAHYFVLDGASHTMTIFGTEGYEAGQGTKLTDWLMGFLGDDPALQSLRP
jgi:hypothetical protein